MQIVEDMLRQSRIEVAWTSEGHYVSRIDLAGRFGPFRLAFRARPYVFLPLSKNRKTLFRFGGAVSITSERTSP
jgi:hypothetical protein